MKKPNPKRAARQRILNHRALKRNRQSKSGRFTSTSTRLPASRMIVDIESHPNQLTVATLPPPLKKIGSLLGLR